MRQLQTSQQPSMRPPNSPDLNKVDYNKLGELQHQENPK